MVGLAGGLRWGARAGALLLGAGLVASLTATVQTVSSSSSFDAVGSAEQVYVTGLAQDQSASLVAPGGTTLSTQSADAQGGLLFRNVP
ncbi:MAG TPA: hypothetical protein DCQ30_03405, partial [Acidimicrobiaceae bacterium]|nr:hypothetical protein [Acidimicrobiaceae bacterium]